MHSYAFLASAESIKDSNKNVSFEATAVQRNMIEGRPLLPLLLAFLEQLHYQEIVICSVCLNSVKEGMFRGIVGVLSQ